MTRKGIPDGWLDYTNVNTTVAGTRIIPFKSPLKWSAFARCPDVEKWTPADVMATIPNLGLVVSLNYTSNPYYMVRDFLEAGVAWEWVRCKGHDVPTKNNLLDFFSIVKNFMSLEENAGKVIGVHCTHGVNRTGYLICRYLIDEMNVDPETSINLFSAARGHEIERENYVNSLFDTKQGSRHYDCY